MTHILLDLSSLQLGPTVGGAAVYTKRIMEELEKQCSITLSTLYNSQYRFHPTYDIPAYIKERNITLIDIQGQKISQITKKHSIDVVFFPLGQYARFYDLTGIKCRIVIAIHDIFNLEEADIKLSQVLYDPYLHHHSLYRLKQFAYDYVGIKQHLLNKYYKQLYTLMTQENTEVITVSHYSEAALKYYIPVLGSKKMRVFYSPEKQCSHTDTIENSTLNDIVSEKQKYFLLISANRYTKNPTNVLKAFKKFSINHPDYLMVTVGYPHSIGERHITLPTLSESDIENAYKYATALIFGSFFEGFGYPPIEAMKYGTPVLASNVTSIPEICGNGAIYFSPFYPASILQAMNIFHEKESGTLTENAIKQATMIHSRQQEDLQNLIFYLLN